MPVGEEIFVKEKPKRKLTQAQLDGLARGRAKVKEKREAEKAKKQNAQNDAKIQKENNKNYKIQKAKKNRTIAEQREIEIQRKLEQQHQEKIEAFNKIKYKYMEKCKNVYEMKMFKEVLDTINEEDIYDWKKCGEKIIKEIKLKYNNNLNNAPRQDGDREDGDGEYEREE
jgi:hypothetical protein